MIYGIGIDIVEIDKIRKIVAYTGNKLAKRILSTSEWQFYLKNRYPERFLAKRFAAKEAAMKAFGLGMRRGLTFKQFEIFNNNLGKPELNLFRSALVLAQDLLLTKIHVTMSDTNIYACAMVIFEQ